MTAPPNSTFRRAIRLLGFDDRVEAELEDDFHRFGLTLRHDGQRVLSVRGRAGRFPWVTCQQAPTALAALEGAALSRDPTILFRYTDPRQQCTHLFELAALAVTQAARGPGERLYETEVSDPVGGRRELRLFQDGVLVLEWRLAGDEILAPSSQAGRTVSSLGSRALAQLPPELAEQLLILRRVTQTATGRSVDLDAVPNAAALGAAGHCYSLQPAALPVAHRMVGSVRQWRDRATLLAALLAGASEDGAAERAED